MHRALTAHPLLGDAWRATSLTGTEALSTLYAFSLGLESDDPEIDRQALIGKAVVVELGARHGLRRYFPGRIARAAAGDVAGALGGASDIVGTIGGLFPGAGESGGFVAGGASDTSPAARGNADTGLAALGVHDFNPNANLGTPANRKRTHDKRGQPTARQGDAAANGVIAQDSATVPIGTGGGGAGCPVCPGGRAVGADGCDRFFGDSPAPGNQGGVRTPLNPVPGAKGVPGDSIRPRRAPRRHKADAGGVAGGVARGEGAIPARRPPGARLEPSVAPRPPHGGKRAGRGKKL